MFHFATNHQRVLLDVLHVHIVMARPCLAVSDPCQTLVDHSQSHRGAAHATWIVREALASKIRYSGYLQSAPPEPWPELYRSFHAGEIHCSFAVPIMLYSDNADHHSIVTWQRPFKNIPLQQPGSDHQLGSDFYYERPIHQ